MYVEFNCKVANKPILILSYLILSYLILSYVICQFIYFQILPGVVNPSPSRLPLLLFPGTTMSIIFLERLCFSLLLVYPYQFNLFCLRNVTFGILWHPLVLPGFRHGIFWSYPLSIVVSSFPLLVICSRRSF